jgi:hypothetical protein
MHAYVDHVKVMWDDRTAEGDDGGQEVTPSAGGGTGESNGGGVGRRVVGLSAAVHDDPRRPLTPSPCFLPTRFTVLPSSGT